MRSVSGRGNAAGASPGAYTTTFTRDVYGRATGVRDPLGRSTGRTVGYGYDDAGRLKSISYSSGAPKPISYGYDPDGRLASMTDGGGSTGFGYDSLGRLASAGRGGRGQLCAMGYDLAGRVTSLAYPDAVTGASGGVGDPTGSVTRGYDADGNLTSVGDWLGHTTRFAYDPDGQLVRTERPDASATVLTRDPRTVWGPISPTQGRCRCWPRRVRAPGRGCSPRPASRARRPRRRRAFATTARRA